METKDSGQWIGNRYELMERLGQGGMGTVFRAKDRLTEQDVALKRVFINTQQLAFHSRSSGMDSIEVRLALAKEFQMLASLRHPHIISVLDYGFDDERQPYFTMELLTGAQDLLEFANSFDREFKVALLVEILQALEYLHRRNVIHRDLKPGNVLVDSDGTLKVLDFGLAVESNLSDQVAGSVAYMAPEILKQEKATEAADLYSLGIIAYEMFAGKHPFNTDSLGALVNDMLNTQPNMDPLEEGEAGMAVAEVIGWLLAKEPGERYRDAGTVIRELCRAVDLPVPEESKIIRESYLQSAPFVGRSAELKRLQTALDSALDGRGSAWLIAGEAGVGKSRLVDEIRTRALIAEPRTEGVSGALVLRGYGVESEGVPYQLWHDVLPRLILANPITDLQAGVLKEILPDIDRLLGRHVADAPRLDERATQQRLLTTIADVFMAAKQPIVLLAEDLHCFRESLLPLKHLVQMARDLPLLIVGTYGADIEPYLYGKLPGMELITLERLPKDDIVTLSTSMLGRLGTSPEVLQFLEKESEGNVFFMVQVLQTLAEEVGQLDAISDMRLPTRVFAEGMMTFIRRRIARLPLSYQPMLRLAAVAGRDVDFRVLQQLDEEVDFMDWLSKCVDAALLELVEEKWRFTHDKLREGIIRMLPADERPKLHRMVAEAIEAVYPGDDSHANALTEHWRRAGNPVKERHYAQISGARAQAAGDYTTALAYYERALAMMPDDQAAERIRLLLRLAAIEQALGNLMEAGDLLETAVEQARALARALKDDDLLQLALHQHAATLVLEGHYAQASTLLTESLRLARDHQDSTRIASSVELQARIAVAQNQMDTAETLFQEALTLYRQLQDVPGIANCTRSLGLRALAQGAAAQARVSLQEYADLLEKSGQHMDLPGALCNLGYTYHLEGRLDEAERLYHEALTLAQRLNVRQDLIDVRCLLGRLNIERGAFDAGREYEEIALRDAYDSQLVPRMLQVLLEFARLDLQMGMASTAAETLGVVLHHEALSGDTRLLIADPLSTLIKAALPEKDFVRALKRGRKRSFDTTVRRLMGDYSALGEDEASLDDTLHTRPTV